MSPIQRPNIAMTDEEVTTFLVEQRTATVATIGPHGLPHLVAIWYAVLDGEIWIETKAKSQKVLNLRRDDRASFMTETGLTYSTLRGVALEGRGVISEDPEILWQVGVSVYERYSAPYSEEVRPIVDALIHKRVAIRFDVKRIRSWDHRKLGLDDTTPRGSTAQYIERR
jgi:PPOX class probable F420-dependent enzyme